ncbi:MAG TPA: hypothetical protein VFK12_03215 [Gammaproteobacteria bacterium]|nr:hypothetical protein [Gammaproteobacteria bacterium]
MKKIILAAAVAAFLGLSATANAHPKHPGHPNIVSAHKLVMQAIKRIEAAQKANEFDLGGHAAKAKDLLAQAESELKQALEAAKTNSKDASKK